MAQGILDFLEFAIAVVFAAPVALLGAILASNGDVIGGVALVVVAIGMVWFERYVVAPRDLLGRILAGAAGRVVRSPDEDS